MPKKRKVNGFSMFLKKYVADQNKKGKNVTMKQMQDEASVLWVRLSQKEKLEFGNQAKDQTYKLKEQEKLTSQGIPLSYLEKEERELEIEEHKMKKEVSDILKTSVLNNSLPEQKFYFIMVNYFTVTTNNLYVPAEIALCKYSLKNGVSSKFHSLINPEVEVYGSAYETMEYSKRTHKLPSPPDALGEKNLNKVYNKIISFLEDRDNEGNIPPLFTLKEHKDIVNGVLNYLEMNITDEITKIKVYPLQFLFYKLKRVASEIGEIKMPDSTHLTDILLERDQFEYTSHISCDIHEKMDNSKYCALSCVIRWGFLISKYICNDLAIPMLPGYHLPEDTLEVPVQSSSSSANKNENKFNVEKDIPKPFINNSSRHSHFNDDIDEDSSDTDESDQNKNFKRNLWLKKNKSMPKPPSEFSFSFSNVAAGFGRGIIKKEMNPSSNINTSIQKKGRYFFKENGNQA